MAERMVGRAAASGASGTTVKPKRKMGAAKKSPKRVADKAAPTFGKKTIALVYDFDGTLSPKPMQEYAFLPTIGEDAKAFWNESNRIAATERADPMITYMRLLYKKAKDKGVTIDRASLVQQGRSVEYFPGVEQWFKLINSYVASKQESVGVEIRHYLISSGLTEIVEGTSIHAEFPQCVRQRIFI